jgi:hypothetical protein
VASKLLPPKPTAAANTRHWKQRPIKKGNLTGFNPFLDDKGILRVGGRLTNSKLPYNSKHPIILPAITPYINEADKTSTTHIINAIITWAHKTTIHGNQQATRLQLLENFQIIHIRYQQ